MYYSYPPLGVQFLRKCCPNFNCISKQTKYRYAILILTYFAYCLYHLSRRPFTIVKSVLAPNCTDLEPNHTCRPWPPFDTENPNYLFGLLDSFYLFSYAIFMFLAGYMAERIHLRYFLSFGMIFSGISTYIFGLGNLNLFKLNLNLFFHLIFFVV